jgi:hypothetical protein
MTFSLLAASAGMFGIAIAIVVGIAVLEWAMPDADVLGHDLRDEKCRRCEKSAWRCGLCTQCYEHAVDDAYADGKWN